MTQLPVALQYLGRLQAEMEKKKLMDGLFEKEIRPDTLISDLVTGARETNALLAHDPRYAPLLKEIPETQSVQHYAILREAKRLFDNLIHTNFREQHRYTTSDKVFFGTLEWNELNALITPVPESDQFLVIVNQLLWDALKVVTYIVTSSVVSQNGSLKFREELAHDHLDSYRAVLTGIANRTPVPTPKRKPKEDYSVWSWETLAQTTGDFVFGHEYSHFLHGHFSKNTCTLRMRIGETDYEGCCADWEREYEADRTAMDLVAMLHRAFQTTKAADADPQNIVASMQSANDGIIAAMQGVLVALNFMCRVEEALGIVYTADSTHPPAWLRLLATWGVIGQQIPPPFVSRLQAERWQPLIDCIEFCATNSRSLDLCPDGTRRAARTFQDAVFQSLFHIRHSKLIDQLNHLQKQLKESPNHIREACAACKGRVEGEILSALVVAADSRAMTPAECGKLVKNTLEIISKNAKVFGF